MPSPSRGGRSLSVCIYPRPATLVRRGAPSPAKIVVDSGSAVDLVHYSPPDQPLSPNQPR
jgi:hypothetical protein